MVHPSVLMAESKN